jgi:olefin beta-lactone synthetase
MNVVEVLRQQACRRPDTPAIVDRRGGQDRSLSFAELESASDRAASLLRRAGLRPGDPVLLFVPMCAELYVALSAVLRSGLVATFLDPSSGRKEIERYCALHPPKGFIATSKAHLLRFASPALRHIPHRFSIGLPVPGAMRWERAERMPGTGEICAAACDTPAILTFTSGSTGDARAAVRTHGFLLAQHRALAQTLDLKADDVDLATLPLFVLANLASGLTSLIPAVDLRRPGDYDPAHVISQIRNYRPSRAGASPAFFERLAGYCEERGLLLPEFYRFFTGGGPVYPSLIERLSRVAPNAEITAVYGSTEAEPIAQIARGDIGDGDMAAMVGGRGLLAGLPVPMIGLRIVSDKWRPSSFTSTLAEFEAACLPTGKSGEIVVSGEHVLSGYLNGHGDEQTKIRVDEEVWHRTGDAGYLDDRGRLWLLGRSVARVEDGKGTLYPFAVECAATAHSGVRRAALVRHNGRRLLIVEPVPGGGPPDCAAIKAALGWAELDEVRLWRQIPVDRRHNSKIDYPALSRQLRR